MNDFIIATASTADIDRSYLEKHHIPFIAYTYTLEGKVYEDDCREETKKNIFRQMREGRMPGTAQIPQYNYHEFFKSLMETGKDVMYLDMSRAISNSYNNALAAEEEIHREYPGQRFVMIDTRCITVGLAFLVKHLVDLKESGASMDQCIDWAEKNKLHIAHHFIVDDLQWLRKGGRLSNANAVVGTLLNIKPILYVADDGSLIASAKVRGKKQALLQIVRNMKNDIGEAKGKEVYIYHADCLADAQFTADKIRESYPDIGEIQLHMEGPTIGAHVGPGFVAVIYLADRGRIF